MGKLTNYHASFLILFVLTSITSCGGSDGRSDGGSADEMVTDEGNADSLGNNNTAQEDYQFALADETLIQSTDDENEYWTSLSVNPIADQNTLVISPNAYLFIPEDPRLEGSTISFSAFDIQSNEGIFLEENVAAVSQGLSVSIDNTSISGVAAVLAVPLNGDRASNAYWDVTYQGEFNDTSVIDVGTYDDTHEILLLKIEDVTKLNWLYVARLTIEEAGWTTKNSNNRSAKRAADILEVMSEYWTNSLNLIPSELFENSEVVVYCIPDQFELEENPEIECKLDSEKTRRSMEQIHLSVQEAIGLYAEMDYERISYAYQTYDWLKRMKEIYKIPTYIEFELSGDQTIIPVLFTSNRAFQLDSAAGGYYYPTKQLYLSQTINQQTQNELAMHELFHAVEDVEMWKYDMLSVKKWLAEGMAEAMRPQAADSDLDSTENYRFRDIWHNWEIPLAGNNIEQGYEVAELWMRIPSYERVQRKILEKINAETLISPGSDPIPFTVLVDNAIKSTVPKFIESGLDGLFMDTILDRASNVGYPHCQTLNEGDHVVQCKGRLCDGTPLYQGWLSESDNEYSAACRRIEVENTDDQCVNPEYRLKIQQPEDGRLRYVLNGHEIDPGGYHTVAPNYELWLIRLDDPESNSQLPQIDLEKKCLGDIDFGLTTADIELADSSIRVTTQHNYPAENGIDIVYKNTTRLISSGNTVEETNVLETSVGNTTIESTTTSQPVIEFGQIYTVTNSLEQTDGVFTPSAFNQYQTASESRRISAESTAMVIYTDDYYDGLSIRYVVRMNNSFIRDSGSSTTTESGMKISFVANEPVNVEIAFHCNSSFAPVIDSIRIQQSHPDYPENTVSWNWPGQELSDESRCSHTVSSIRAGTIYTISADATERSPPSGFNPNAADTLDIRIVR